MAKQDVDQAIAHYVQALRLRPDDSNAHYNLATALKQKGDVERAAQEYETALELERQRQP
jgi:Flp pilus assembly protein TadD